MTDKPKFPIHDIPESLWLAVAGVQSTGFADSYLYGAVLRNRQLIPRTISGYLALRDKCSKLLEHLNIELVKPKPFHESGRSPAAEELAGHFGRRDR